MNPIGDASINLLQGWLNGLSRRQGAISRAIQS